MSKAKKIGVKAIKKQLTEAVDKFIGTPALDLILDNNSPLYCETRAIELLRESIAVNNFDRLISNQQLAITLIAAALIMRNPS